MEDLKEMKYQIELYYYWKSKLVELNTDYHPCGINHNQKLIKPEQVVSTLSGV